MSDSVTDVRKIINTRKIIYPVLLGLLIVFYMLYKKVDSHTFSSIHWTYWSTLWMGLAITMLAMRDFAYMVRLRILSKKELSWKQCFEIVMCWEFASALAPGSVGGGFAFAIYAISKEKGMTLGKSAAIVLFTSFLDGLFFILTAPFIYFLLTKQLLFYNVVEHSQQLIKSSEGLHNMFWTIYGLIIVYKLFVGYALFINAAAVKKILMKLFSLKILVRWQSNVELFGDELILASTELKKEKINHWIGGFLSTSASWTARFTIVNCIVAAFSSIDFSHFLLFGRQIVVGILMMGTPTPGGAGLAELSFQNFYGEFIGNAGLTVALALLWRMLSYYPYLIAGVIVVPRWLKRVMV